MRVFDDGNFSESETVLLSDSMAHLPPEVLSKNFAVAEVAKKISPGESCSSSRPLFPGRWRGTRKQPQEHLGSRRAISHFARWKCRRRSARKAERYASLIRARSRPQLTLRWRCPPCIPDCCGN